MSTKALYDLREMVCAEIEKTAKKEKISSTSELDLIDKLTHSLKSIDTIIAMQEAQDYADGYSERGYSEARGRGRNARRDRYGQYSRDDGHSYHDGYSERYDGRDYSRDDGYSRDGGSYRGYSNAGGDMMEKMRRMMEQAGSEEERKAIRKIMGEMEK